ncbi:MAG: phosphoribosylglycinamide synthetase C domain-containing protein [Candidatus Limnocylindrales bacterium]
MSPHGTSGRSAAGRGPRRVLVLGGGGREHALVWSLAREAGVTAVIVAPGSDAIATEDKVRCLPAVSPLDPAAVVGLATAEDVDLVVVGPEAPLAAGVADALMGAGVPVFGPSRAAARIEWSKSFCRDVAAAAGVRMARGRDFTALEPALAFARDLAGAHWSRGVVVKADGLAAGKGVTVCDDYTTAERALKTLFANLPPAGAGAAGETGAGAAGETGAEAEGAARAEPAQPVVVLEERLFGAEASLIALCDDHAALALPPARDHKRLLDGDEGPNTGGMGAYSPVPDLPESLCATLVDVVHLPILAELARRGAPFRGALYAGLMLTPEGPVLIECNARFGDPEAQALLPRLAVPLGPLLLGAARGDLAAAMADLGLHGRVLPTTGDAAVAIVMAAANYPETPRKGDTITGLEEAARAGATIFHAGTVREPDGQFRTNGGRVLSVVGLGAGIPAARQHAERAAALIGWQGMQRRHDIAAKLPPAADPRTAVESPSPISATGWGGTGGRA